MLASGNGHVTLTPHYRLDHRRHILSYPIMDRRGRRPLSDLVLHYPSTNAFAHLVFTMAAQQVSSVRSSLPVCILNKSL